jgi:hypothetical protein
MLIPRCEYVNELRLSQWQVGSESTGSARWREGLCKMNMILLHGCIEIILGCDHVSNRVVVCLIRLSMTKPSQNVPNHLYQDQSIEERETHTYSTEHCSYIQTVTIQYTDVGSREIRQHKVHPRPDWDATVKANS